MYKFYQLTFKLNIKLKSYIYERIKTQVQCSAGNQADLTLNLMEKYDSAQPEI